MQTIRKYYRVDRRQIGFLKFIIEAYDGAALLRTLDPAAGLVVFHVSPGCEALLDEVLAELQQEIMIEDAREGK